MKIKIYLDLLLMIEIKIKDNILENFILILF